MPRMKEDADQEPQAFKLLGSAHATFCIHLDYSPNYGPQRFIKVAQYKRKLTASQWYASVEKVATFSTDVPKKLSKFFICGA